MESAACRVHFAALPARARRDFCVPNAGLPAKLKNRQMINNKQSAITDLGASLRHTANWRRELSKKFINDARNIRAAETLERLANEVNELSDESWLLLASHYSWCSPAWSDAVSLASRHVEFRNVKTLSAFMDCLVGLLPQSVAA